MDGKMGRQKGKGRKGGREKGMEQRLEFRQIEPRRKGKERRQNERDGN